MSVNIYDPTKVENDGLTPIAGMSDSSKFVWKISALPAASADLEGRQYLLLGTQTGYTKGCLYECTEVTPATDPKTYTWTAITGTAVTKNATDKVEPGNHSLVESNAVSSAIAQAISTVFTPHGNLTCAELLSALLIEANVGNLYNMTDSGTTTSDFVGGAGQTINVGDTVGIITTGPSEYKFNLMPGLQDLSQYANVFYGYLNPTDGKFYKEDTFVTEIPGKADALFVNVTDWVPYAYDETNMAYVAVGGGSGIFPGTIDEWNALSEAEKAKYDFIASPEENGYTDSYSTTETKTNKVWIDGKPIYRRVFVPTSYLFTNGYVTISSESWVTEIEVITRGIIISGAVTVTAGRYYKNGNNLRFNLGYEFNGGPTNNYVILEYTKTTDD